MIEAVQRARAEYSSSGDIKVLREAVRLGRMVLERLSGQGAALHGAAANDLAASLGMLYEATGKLRHLDEQLGLLDRALDLLPPGDENRATAYSNICGGRLRRFIRSGDGKDVAAALAAGQQSVAEGPPDSPDRAVWYGNFAGALRALFTLTGDRPALDESIAVGRAAAEAIQPSTIGQSMILGALAGSLQQRGRQMSSLADLEESITIARRAVAAAAPGSPWYQTARSVLATALGTKAELAGDLASLSESVTIHREAAERVPESQAERGLHLVNLASALLVRYEWQEDQADLVAAQDAAQRAGSAGAAFAAGAWSVLATCWRLRAAKLAADGDQAKAVDAINRSVEAARKSLAMAGAADDPDHLLIKCNSLATRYQLTGKRTHRAKAIAAYREATGKLGADTPNGQLAMLNLGKLLLFHQTSRLVPEPVALEALRLFRRVLAATSPGGLRWGHASASIIQTQAQLWQVGSTAFEPVEMEHMYRQVTQARAVPPRHVATAGLVTGGALMFVGDTEAAASVLSDVVRQLPAVAWRGARRKNRETALEMFSDVAPHAAACLLMADGRRHDSAAEAVKVLEQGRAVLWADMLELRRGESWEGQPELTERLRELAMVLDAPDDDLGDSRSLDRRMAAAALWDTTVAEIRKSAPGFLRPPRPADMLPRQAKGPVVVVNISDLRCDALIVTSASVTCVPLPSLTSQDIRHNTLRYLDAQEGLAKGGEALGADQTMAEVLRWLWDTIAGPVLAALGIDSAPAPGQPWPRIWWCPTGVLSLLPLHAAGYHGAAPRAVIDLVISSYTPTMGALADASGADPGDGTLLFVGVPDSQGMPSLPGPSEERDFLTTRLGPACHVLYAGDATVTAVRTALRSHRLVHFSCHGEQDLTAPSKGSLSLWDGTLTVTDLSARELNGEFAFLAACKTATGSVSLPNEAISLAAAIHFAGYRHVIATLWTAHDYASAEITQMVYGDLAASGRLEPARSAEALHAAVRHLRGINPRPSWWTPFIHVGP